MSGYFCDNPKCQYHLAPAHDAQKVLVIAHMPSVAEMLKKNVMPEIGSTQIGQMAFEKVIIQRFRWVGAGGVEGNLCERCSSAITLMTGQGPMDY